MIAQLFVATHVGVEAGWAEDSSGEEEEEEEGGEGKVKEPPAEMLAWLERSAKQGQKGARASGLRAKRDVFTHEPKISGAIDRASRP